MKNYQIIDNLDEQNTMIQKLNYFIPLSKKCLFVGIGYFLSSGFEKIRDHIIDISNQGSSIKFIAGNIYIEDQEGNSIINPNLDLNTYQFIVDLYEKSNGNIEFRTVKKRFFHGKFFLGRGDTSTYLIGGSSNLSNRAMTSSKRSNLEYNFFIEDDIDSEIINTNEEWFLHIWNDSAVSLNDDDISHLKFLINKAKFNIDVQEDITEKGSHESKSRKEIEVEIIDNILKNIGFNTVEPAYDKSRDKINDLFVDAIHYLYRNKENEKVDSNNIHECIESLSYRLQKSYSTIETKLNEQINNTSFRDYYYDILESILHRNTDRSIKPSYSNLLIQVRDIFIEYYENYHNKAYQRGSYGTQKGEKRKSLNSMKMEKTDFEFQKPYFVSTNRFNYLLKMIQKMKGNFEDDWLFSYQSYDANNIIERYNLTQKGVYLAHEAGMGKSPIICKFIKEVQRNKWDTRFLITVPASLLYQWKNDNLKEDFGLESQIVDREQLIKEGNNVWKNRKINIVSIDFLKDVIEKENNENEIISISPDILIVDEAHNLKNNNSIRYDSFYKLKPAFTFLASATPLQNNVKEFLVQLKLIDSSVEINKYNDVKYIKQLSEKYLIRKTRMNELAEIKKIKQSIRDVKKIIVPTTNLFNSLYLELEQTLKEDGFYLYQFLGEIKGKEEHYKNINCMICFNILQQLSSSVTACVEGFKNIQRKICMVLNFIQNYNTELLEKYNQEDKDLLIGIAENRNKITPEKIKKLQDDLERIDIFINPTNGLLYNNGKPIMNPKEDYLINLITGDMKDKQLIIFVKYTSTGELLKDNLTLNQISSEFFTGSLNKTQRNNIVQKFKNGDIQVLIATDSANAGLNLQFTDTMFNYDLNWNPQIVEQRIGRIHRIGQQSDKVTILNLFLENTVDERINKKMEEKIKKFQQFFTVSDRIVGEPISEEEIKSKLILSISKISKDYFENDINRFDIDISDKNEETETIDTLLNNNLSEINKVNEEYYYQQEVLRELLMWVLCKYNIDYYNENDDYYLKLDNGDVYYININQVYNMIDKENEFFNDFNFNGHIESEKVKGATDKIEGMYFVEDSIDKNLSLLRINGLKVNENTKLELKNLITQNTSLLQLNLNVEFLFKNNKKEFSNKELKTIILKPDMSIETNEDIIKLLSLLPSKKETNIRIDTLDKGENYQYIYNHILPESLKTLKSSEIQKYDTEVLYVKIKIFSGTILSFE